MHLSFVNTCLCDKYYAEVDLTDKYYLVCLLMRAVMIELIINVIVESDQDLQSTFFYFCLSK